MASLGEFLAPGLYRKPEDQPWFVRMFADLESQRKDGRRQMTPEQGLPPAGSTPPFAPPQMAAPQMQQFTPSLGAPQINFPGMQARAGSAAPPPQMGGGMGMPAMAPQQMQVPEPQMQAPTMQMPSAPQINMPKPSLGQRLGSGMGERLLPAAQLEALGMTPDQIASAQTAAIRRFGMGMLSNVGSGEGFGAGLGRGFAAAGPEQMKELTALAQIGDRRKERKEDVAYREGRAKAEDSQFQAQLDQRAALAEKSLAQEVTMLERRIKAEIALKGTPDPLEAEKIRQAKFDLELIKRLAGKPFDKMSDNEKALFNKATGGAVGDLIRAERPAGGGFDFGMGGMPDLPPGAAPTPAGERKFTVERQ